MRSVLTTTIMLTGTLTLGSGVQAVPLVREGEPAAVIVLSQTPSPVAYEAATELQRVIRRISGATLPIYLEGEWGDGQGGPQRFTTRVFVGDSEGARAAGLDLSAVGPEGYVIRSVPWFYPQGEEVSHMRHPVLILAGRDERKAERPTSFRGGRADLYTRGTAYAVYAFLEEDLGVRWLWPGELGEVVPQMDTIDVSPADRTGAPKLTQRLFRNHTGRVYRWQAAGAMQRRLEGIWLNRERGNQWWMDHLGLGESAGLSRVAGREGMGDEFAERYAESNPEYFALQPDGTRLARSSHGRVRLCLSNPEVIRLVAQQAIDAFDRNPQRRVHGIELADVFGSYCVCEECQAWGPTLSDLVARHWSAVAELVAEVYPDRLLYAHPYHLYVDPPVEVTQIPDSILLAPVGRGLTYFPDHPAWAGSGDTAAVIRARSLASFVGWAKLSNQKMMWRPNYGHHRFAGPLNYSRALAEDLKVKYEHGLAYVDIDWMVNQWSGEGLSFYVASKLFWDPELDYEALIDDYCEKGFGPAGRAVRAYFDALEEIYEQVAAEATDRRHLVYYYPPEVSDRLHHLLDAAQATAQGEETVLERIAFLRSAVEYVEIEYRASVLRADLDAKVQAGERPSDEEIEAARALVAERQEFIEGFIGGWALEPELLWSGAMLWGDWGEWLEEIAAPADLWAELWEDHEEVMTLPEEGWRFAPDPQRVGLTEAWFAPDFDDSEWATLRVGDFWHRQGFPDYYGAAWYRLRVTVPAELAGKRVIFSFGAADEGADVYLDGELAGVRPHDPDGWDERFELDLTEHVKPGVEQTLAIRVVATMGMGGLWRPIKIITPREHVEQYL